MKTNQIKLLGGTAALVLFGAVLVQGCSSSDDSSGGTSGSGGATGGKGGSSSTAGKGGTASGTAGTTSGAAGKGGTSSGTAGSSAGGGSSAGDTGTTEGGASGAPGGNEGGAAGATAPGDGRDCTKFCADEATTCSGALSPYASTGACMSACEGFALGGDPTTTTSGDTYACRRYHLSAAASPGPATTHCPHTGLISKNALTDTSATGPCK